jgi:hypothetical protein
MKKLLQYVRIGFGAILLGIGVANLSGAMPPMHYPEPAHTFMTAMQDTGYIMVIVSVMKVLVGLSMVTHRYVPLALVAFFPITVNMILFHAFLDLRGIAPALAIGLLHVYLLVGYIDVYRPLWGAKPIRATG